MYLQNTLDSTGFICQIHIFIQGVFGDGDFSDLNNVIKTCACPIYIVYVSHGAVKFGQYDEYAFPPFYPGILTGKPPDNKVKVNTPNVL